MSIKALILNQSLMAKKDKNAKTLKFLSDL
jgi:hypothetical protein